MRSNNTTLIHKCTALYWFSQDISEHLSAQMYCNCLITFYLATKPEIANIGLATSLKTGSTFLGERHVQSVAKKTGVTVKQGFIVIGFNYLLLCAESSKPLI